MQMTREVKAGLQVVDDADYVPGDVGFTLDFLIP
jgi:hypothetical protein